jgi:hypothetical protein
VGGCREVSRRALKPSHGSPAAPWQHDRSAVPAQPSSHWNPGIFGHRPAQQGLFRPQQGIAVAALEQPAAAPKAAGPPAGPPGSAVDPCAAEPDGRDVIFAGSHRSRAFGQLHDQV